MNKANKRTYKLHGCVISYNKDMNVWFCHKNGKTLIWGSLKLCKETAKNYKQ